MTKSNQTTLGSTVADSPSDPAVDQPVLATFDREEPRFALAEELGRGGMGRVVAAVDVQLARSVAIKQVLSVRPDDLARFEREVLITAQLEHPSIVPIHEAARDAEGRPYYVMRRIDGDPLSRRLEGANTGARLAMLPNFLAVVDAAAFAHARKIIHRDIKPSNILLGNYGETHLIDWGLARRVDDLEVSNVPIDSGQHELTRAGHIYGTVAYMAPEQARGERVDQRADVYALGATLFHVLAGCAPFADLSEAERIAAAETGEDRIPLGKIPDDVPHELVAIVDKATAREPDRRYQHAGELAADVRAFLAGKLVAAHRYTIGQRLGRFVRRHRLAVAIGTIAVIAIVAITIVSLGRIVRERGLAEDAAKQAQESNALAVRQLHVTILDRAAALLKSDPTHAIAMLRTVPANSEVAPRARDLVAAAIASGVVHGKRTHVKPINGLAFSHDHTRLVSVGEDGKVVMYDVRTAAAHVVTEEPTAIYRIAWTDDDKELVLQAYQRGLRVVDAATGAERELIQGEEIAGWWLTRDRVRYFDQSTGRVFEIPIAGGSPRELLTDVTHVEGAGDRMVYTTTADKLRVRDGTTVRDVATVPRVSELAFSSRLHRAAIRDGTAITEWDLETGRDTGSWNVPVAMGLTYSGRGPVIIGRDYRLKLLRPAGEVVDTDARITPFWSGDIAKGRVFAGETGEITIDDDAGLHTLPFDYPGTRAITGTPEGTLIAFGHQNGTVRWIDLATVLPKVIPLGPSAKVCMADHDRMLAVEYGQLLDIDLATTKVTRVAEDYSLFDPGTDCSSVIGNHVAVTATTRGSIVDLAHGIVAIHEGRFWAVVDEDDKRIVSTFDNQVVDWDQATQRETRVLTVDKRVNGLATLHEWLVAVLEGGIVMRKNRITGVIETEHVPEILHFGLGTSGRLWFASGDSVWEWLPGQKPVAIHQFGLEIARARGRDADTYVQLADGSVWAVSNPDHQIHPRAPAGTRAVSFGTSDVALSYDNGRLTTHYLASGDSFARDAPQIRSAFMLDDGIDIAAVLHDKAIIFHDSVPRTFAAARAWIDNVTNATVDDDTGALGWR